MPLEGGVELIILEKNPVQWLGEGGGERVDVQKEIDAGVQED